MELSVLPLHKHPEYLQNCCDLINSEWKRSDTARLRSLEASNDHLPVSLILLKEKRLLGHLKLSPIPSIGDGCFVESVVIDQSERGKGYGSILMAKGEEYCRSKLKLNSIYLSTKGQEGFYSKLGYIECAPISIYGSGLSMAKPKLGGNTQIKPVNNNNIPKAPPMPLYNNIISSSNVITSKTYMKKDL